MTVAFVLVIDEGLELLMGSYCVFLTLVREVRVGDGLLVGASTGEVECQVVVGYVGFYVCESAR